MTAPDESYLARVRASSSMDRPLTGKVLFGPLTRGMARPTAASPLTLPPWQATVTCRQIQQTRTPTPDEDRK